VPIHPQITRILEKLAQARHRGCKCFGSESHSFRLNRRLLESSLIQFEQQHEIRLPEGYREFLLEAGNGGAGPYYGLLPLDAWAEATDGPLAEAYPFLPDAPRARALEQIDLPWCSQGTITICHQGCAYYALLVVSGPARGRIAYVAADDLQPHFVEDESFLCWYERWLDELLAGYDLFWFGFSIPGDESRLVPILLSDPSPEQRARAASSLLRLPSLAQDSARAVLRALQDESPEVRVSAAGVLGRFKIDSGVGLLRTLLGDPDPEVRRAALRALTKFRSARWIRDAKQLLSDADPRVVQTALFLLDDTGALKRSEIVPLLGCESALVRSTSAYLLGKRGGVLLANARARALLHLLNDPDRYVRIQAIQALSRPKASIAVPLLSKVLREDSDSLILVNAVKALAAIGGDGSRPAFNRGHAPSECVCPPRRGICSRRYRR
jgi:hypothetical protein